ncbi:cyclase family protein [Gordonia humi]|uniref:Kynurenine formamidase n=1 Tax=Gordonia humi TaxID=686429 RepID=A0A840F1E9_9ACTN|nr:cyclase family protein [Gordonia humi]MBB4136338.1 kynurenine formamidase [Gordonia humi]
MTAGTMPSYDELPELAELGVRHSWGLLPHEAGTLAFIDADQVRRAAATVTEGRAIALSEPIATFDQPLFERDALTHSVVEVGRNELEDVFDRFNPQAYSQIDGLAHVRAREFGFYGGLVDVDEARERLGMHHWAQRSICGRGVLLDVHRSRQARGEVDDPTSGSAILPDELDAVAREQGVALERGDIVLVRTGWLEAFRDLPAGCSVTTWNGLHAGEATAEFLWNSGVALLGADNPAVEDAPGSRDAGSLHRRLLPGLGLSLLELLRLDELAQACADARRWEFLFTAAPLPVHGAVSSPANAVAIL